MRRIYEKKMTTTPPSSPPPPFSYIIIPPILLPSLASPLLVESLQNLGARLPFDPCLEQQRLQLRSFKDACIGDSTQVQFGFDLPYFHLAWNGLLLVVVVIDGSTGIVRRGRKQGVEGGTWLLEGVVEMGCSGGARDCI